MLHFFVGGFVGLIVGAGLGVFEAHAIKDHVTNEVARIKAAVTSEIKALEDRVKARL